MATDLGELQNKLWEAADQLRANSGLKASEYASPVLGLIFLRYADERFAQAAEVVGPGSARRPTGPEDYQAVGALYLPEDSRFDTLLNLSEDADIGKAINQAMGGIEVYAQVSPPNADAYVNWLDTLFEHNLGHAGAHRLTIRIDQVNDKDVCRIDVPASSRPIWVKSKDGSDILYQRRNNSTRQVPPTEVAQFITERFGNQHAN